ncbi:uncharacterized protein LOC106150464 [Lingula anatina]|uniref:Uncharacterized protein LOC106150464 n=1 Tax=Lingula anatina TaxID=7574 RepID=A0A1S3GZW2_LINAN|nr:uncharacterized protein LOC106150464 [Lingula anatina]|eukprot:XP_013378771.1 uncharacterized protein LOC106150464 [Lingula anatina]
MSARQILSILLFLAIINVAYAVLCYQCNSRDHPDCGDDPFSGLNLTTTMSCVRCKKWKRLQDGSTYIERGCDTSGRWSYINGCLYKYKSGSTAFSGSRSGPNTGAMPWISGTENHECYCDTSLCNRGSDLHTKVTFVAILAFFISVFGLF